MKRRLTSLIVAIVMSIAAPVWAVNPFQSSAPITTVGAADQVLTQLNLSKTTVSWNSGTSARYLMVFDATTLPSNGSTSTCTSSHVTGCMLWCRYMVNSTSAPSDDWADWNVNPLAAQFGLVIAVSTGAGCGTLTIDTGANETFSTQAY